MSQSFPSVAVVGATGNIGLPIVRALSASQPPFTSITVLTRSPPSSPSSFPPSVTVKVVDYTSPSSLIPALTGVDALVFAVSSRATLSEIPIIDAAVAAGVKFIIPTEYGHASTLPQFEDFNAFAAKRTVHRHLAPLKEAGKIDYALIFTGLWIDVTGLGGFLIAQAVVGVLEGKTAGKTEVRIKNIDLSQKRFRELCEEVVGKDGWEITHLDTEERTKVARQKFADGTAGPEDHYSFVKRAAAIPGYGGPWNEEEDDSPALGLKKWSEEDVLEFITEYVKGQQ